MVLVAIIGFALLLLALLLFRKKGDDMAVGDKWDIEGVRVDQNNVMHAEGGFSGGIVTGNSYSITQPSGGDVRTFNPATATIDELMDFVATLAGDIIK
jgi:hypothetical protein